MSRYFVRETTSPASAWGTGESGFVRYEVDRDRLTALRRGLLASVRDVDAAEDLLTLIYDDLQAFGTGGGEVCDNQDMRVAIPALSAVMERLGLPLELPFRDLESFKTYWIRKGCTGSWQARRDLVDGLLSARLDEVLAQQSRAKEPSVVESISPHDVLGWPTVDAEIQAMREEFRDARTPQNCRAVGLHSVSVLEALSAVAYEHGRHGDGGDLPPVSNTKDRLERIIEVELEGPAKRELRALVRAAIVAAQRVKHGGTPTRLQAGICADATLLVANIIRRLREDPD